MISTPANSASVGLRLPDVIQKTGLSRSSVYRALGNGSLRAKRFGKRVIFEAAEVERFMKQLPTWTPVNDNARHVR
jgi:excisionase family DNA binding protein